MNNVYKVLLSTRLLPFLKDNKLPPFQKFKLSMEKVIVAVETNLWFPIIHRTQNIGKKPENTVLLKNNWHSS
jgi:hypothetical protein